MDNTTTRYVLVTGLLLAVLLCFTVWISDTETDQQTPPKMITVIGSDDCGMEEVLLESAIKHAEKLGNFVLTKDEYSDKMPNKQEVAFPIPLSHSPNILLDMMTDLHKSTKPGAKNQQSTQGIAIAHSPGQIHIFRAEKYPKGVLSIPVLCHTNGHGVYAWGGAGVHEDQRTEVPVLTAGEVYKLYEEGKIDETDIARNTVSEQSLRSVALSETASYLLRAAEILVASLVTNNHTGLDAILRSLRNTLSKDPSTAEHIISSLQPASLQSGVSFSLPFSFLAPSPPPALSYSLIEGTVFPVTPPQILSFDVFNPTNAELTHAPFKFIVETAKDCFVQARFVGGLCEVVNYEDVDEGSEEDSGSGSEGEGSEYTGEKRHEIACVIDSVPAIVIKSVSVTVKVVSKPPPPAEGTSGDAILPTVSNTCYAATYLGNGVVRLLRASSKNSDTPPEEVLLHFSIVMGDDHHDRLPSPFSVFCSFVVLFLVSLIVSVAVRRYSTSSKLFLLLSRFGGSSYVTSTRLDALNLFFGLMVGFMFPPPTTDTVTYRTLLLPVIVVTALGGLTRCALFVSGSLSRVVLTLMFGPHLNADPAWPTNSMSKTSNIGVTIDQGRLADDLVLTYLPYDGITTTLTAWHGDECHIDIEHWSDKNTGFDVDVRMTMSEFSPATVTGTFGQFQYKPHSSRYANTIVTRDPVVVQGGQRFLSLVPQQTVSFSIQQSLSGAVFDSRLTRGEGFALSAIIGDVNATSNIEPRNRQGVLLLNPITTSLTVQSELQPELLRPPSGIHLTRVRDWPPAAILITLHNVRNTSLSVKVDEICRLPKCKDAGLYLADHFGTPTCTPRAVDFINAGAYETYILSKHSPCS